MRCPEAQSAAQGPTRVARGALRIM
jgi:hypothetical protein